MPDQLYPNQRMDLLDNEQKRVNLSLQQATGWGDLEVRGYYEKVDHYANFGDDKQLVYGTATNGMPMTSESDNLGATVKATIDLNDSDALRVGAELQQYTLDDYWDPSGTGAMSPNVFLNVNNGERDRYAAFASGNTRPAASG